MYRTILNSGFAVIYYSPTDNKEQVIVYGDRERAEAWLKNCRDVGGDTKARLVSHVHVLGGQKSA